MAKRKKQDKAIFQQVARFNQEGLHNRDFQRKQLQRRRNQLRFLTDTKEEKELWRRFKEIIHDKREKLKQEDINKKLHFDFDHVKELGVDWDLLIIMGEKNIGKTYAQSQLVRRTIEEDPDAKFFFIRTTSKELKGAFKIQLEEKQWPILLKNTTNTPARLEWKSYEIKPPKYTKLKDFYIGYATHVNGNGLISCQGGSYKNLKYCIWDEFNDDGNLKRDYKDRLLRFFLSIQRDNTNFRLIMCGNLLGTEGKALGHVMLDEFGIPFDAKLKYRVTKHWDDNIKQFINFKLLYINIGGTDELYDGVKSQTFTYMFGEESARDLITNLPAYRTNKVVNKVSFLKSNPWFSWVVTYENIHYCIYIGQVIIEWTEKDKSYYYIMHIDFYTKDNTELGYAPISDEITTTNLFGMLLKSWSEIVADKFNTLQSIIEAGALYFSNDPTRELFNNKLYPKLLKKYDSHLKDWF